MASPPSPTVAFTVLTQLSGPKANETEMDAALLIKNGEELLHFGTGSMSNQTLAYETSQQE